MKRVSSDCLGPPALQGDPTGALGGKDGLRRDSDAVEVEWIGIRTGGIAPVACVSGVAMRDGHAVLPALRRCPHPLPESGKACHGSASVRIPPACKHRGTDFCTVVVHQVRNIRIDGIVPQAAILQHLVQCAIVITGGDVFTCPSLNRFSGSDAVIRSISTRLGLLRIAIHQKCCCLASLLPHLICIQTE